MTGYVLPQRARGRRRRQPTGCCLRVDARPELPAVRGVYSRQRLPSAGADPDPHGPARLEISTWPRLQPSATTTCSSPLRTSSTGRSATPAHRPGRSSDSRAPASRAGTPASRAPEARVRLRTRWRCSLPADLALGPDGSLYVAESAVPKPGEPYPGGRVRRIGTDGRISTVAGTGAYGSSGDGGLAVAAQLGGPTGLAFGPDGSLYIGRFLRLARATRGARRHDLDRRRQQHVPGQRRDGAC